MHNDNKITGIILAGGKSSRMGKDKGYCTIKGKPMVMYAVDLLSQVCDNIIISSNNPDYKQFGYTVVEDEIKNIGPLGGIYSGLKQSTTQHNFFLSCDMPMVSAELVQYILSSKEGFDAVIPTWNNFPEPMCAYYNKDIFESLDNFIQKGQYKLQNVVKSLHHKMLEITRDLPFYNDQLFTNVNSEADLNNLQIKK
jgi:molybdopterin-guanine dinucleotide biosynthesis protein A